MKMILISGPQGSGKTSLQEALETLIYPNPRTRAIPLNFADPIKYMHDFCRNILRDAGITPPHEVKDGDLMQLLGTEWGREKVGPNVWVDHLRGRINKTLELASLNRIEYIFIVADCRFRNEFDGFPDALRVRLACPQEIRKTRASMWRENITHPSEIDLDEYSLEGKFDLNFATGGPNAIPSKEIAEQVLAELNLGIWKERR